MQCFRALHLKEPNSIREWRGGLKVCFVLFCFCFCYFILYFFAYLWKREKRVKMNTCTSRVHIVFVQIIVKVETSRKILKRSNKFTVDIFCTNTVISFGEENKKKKQKQATQCLGHTSE